MISTLQQVDTDLLIFLNSLHCDMLDPVMKAMTGRFIWIPLYVLLAAAVWVKLGPRRAIFSFLLIGLTILMADQICNSIIRPLALRLRPSNLDNPISSMIHVVDGYRAGRYGMASCHAANLAALITYLLRTVKFSRTAAFLLIIWAVTVVYTRIYLGVHYPGDILVGAAVGILVAYGTSALFRRYSNRVLTIQLPHLSLRL